MSLNFSIQFSLGIGEGVTPFSSPMGAPFASRPSLTRDLSMIWAPNQAAIYNKPIVGANRALSSPGPIGSNRYTSPGAPVGNGPLDLLRASGALSAGVGISYASRNTIFQTQIAFTETRNTSQPTMAASLSAGVALGNGLNIGLGGVYGSGQNSLSVGLSGILGNIAGGLGISLGGTGTTLPVPGTVSGALSSQNAVVGNRGLIRGPTAQRAQISLQQRWGSRNTTSGAQSALNTQTYEQKGIQARGDEGAYGLMIGAATSYFGYDGGVGTFIQRWVAGSRTIRKESQYPSSAGRLFAAANGSSFKPDLNTPNKTIPQTQMQAGVTMPAVDKAVKYGDVYGKNLDATALGSDIAIQQYYFNSTAKYPTKMTDKQSSKVQQINATLQASLQKIRDSNYKRVYMVDVPNEASVIRSGKSSKDGYDRLIATTTGQKGVSPMNYPLGVLQDYRDKHVAENSTTTDHVNNSSKLPTAGHFDAINTLQVLSGDKKIPDTQLQNWMEWKPYVDDQIAFFFYDVVNDKYIPFRATIKGMSEVGNATWDELPFIGRGDKVYSYGGFNRTLALNFHIAIGSIAELMPTFQRLNYLTTLIKPSNYTKGDHASSRFMVPPMVFLTVGDMYKDQPVLIQSITTTIPDDASWETLNEYNTTNPNFRGSTWHYLASYISAPQILYGQLPRSIDIGLSFILLEKERAVVGGANFGHAPRKSDLNDNWTPWNTNTPKGEEPNKFHQKLVVNVINSCNGNNASCGGSSGGQSTVNAVNSSVTDIHGYEPEPSVLPQDIHGYEPESAPFTVPTSLSNTNNFALPFNATNGQPMSIPITSQLQPSSNRQLSAPASVLPFSTAQMPNGGAGAAAKAMESELQIPVSVRESARNTPILTAPR